MEKAYEKVIKILVDKIDLLEWQLARAEEDAKMAREELRAERKIQKEFSGE